jgi:serine protease
VLSRDPPSAFAQVPAKSNASPFTGFIIVCLANEYAAVPGATLLEVAEEALPELARFLKAHRLYHSTRLIISTSPEDLAALEEEAAHRTPELAPLKSLRQYWRVDVRAQAREFNVVSAIAADFVAITGIMTATVETRLELPSVDPTDDPGFAKQFYLRAPPAGGIDAQALWGMGFDGSGAGFVDVEGGWFRQHLDLPGALIGTRMGDTMDIDYMPHGTSVLGIVAGVDNARGVIGVAPGVSRISVASVFRSATGTVQWFLADAIVGAVQMCNAGDVILVEWQKTEPEGYLPVEIVDEYFHAIRLAAALNRVVIEPAGNGKSGVGVALDAVSRGGANVLRRGVRESGAIVVAASYQGPGFEPLADSDYGTRIDCFAPGESITTLDYDSSASGGAQSTCRDDFGRTSAASAIVAGAAVLLQSAWRSRTGGPLGALKLRDLLSDPALNWPQGASPHYIGCMPDLGRIIDAALPDIYLRDDVYDDGSVPSTGALSMSPDIIVRQAQVADATAAFGEMSGTANDAALSDDVRHGNPNYIYARLRNRGSLAAFGTTVDIYWSPPATLITPADWTRIGTTKPFDVPVGNSLAVSQPLTWPASAIPNAGHYCFIGVASHPDDRTIIDPMTTWDQFIDLVRSNNNVAWRNFQVINPVAATDAGWLRFPFRIRGAPHGARVFTLQVELQFLTARAAWMEVPAVVAEQLRRSRMATLSREDVMRFLDACDCDANAPVELIDLSVEAGLRSRLLLLDGNASHACSIIVGLPLRDPSRASRVVVRQFFEGIEVGRLTWSFAPRAAPVGKP